MQQFAITESAAAQISKILAQEAAEAACVAVQAAAAPAFLRVFNR